MNRPAPPPATRPRIRPIKRSSSATIAGCLLTFLHPVLFALPVVAIDQPLKTATKHHPYVPPEHSLAKQSASDRDVAHQDIENGFITALAQASQCPHHAQMRQTRSSADVLQPHRPRLAEQRQRRSYFLSPGMRPIRPRKPTRQECLDMVDFYGGEFCTLSTSTQPPECLQVEEKDEPRSVDEAPRDEISDTEVERVCRTLRDRACDHEKAWRAYQSLPYPGLSLLPDWFKYRLLQKLTIIEHRNPVAMFRYTSIMDQMHSTGCPIRPDLWNSAIAFAAHEYSSIDATSVEAAILKWKEMENDHGIKSGHVTFNILFDIATKAEKFVLAEMILQEMKNRGIRISRHMRVALIYYHGMKGDGSAVRQAYRDYINAGQIVDTVVLNCVIASLLRSGEPEAAETVFGRMKRILATSFGRQIPNLDWRQARDLGNELDNAAKTYKLDPRRRREIQDKQFLAPDPQTYHIFVNHHAKHTGEILKISSLVSEMQHIGMPMDGLIFLRIFQGFAYHGGVRYTAWTKTRLDSVWNALLSALDQNFKNIDLDRWLAVWVVRAFEKCFGSAETLAIWEELRRRWKGDFGELAAVQETLKETLTNAVHHQSRTI